MDSQITVAVAGVPDNGCGSGAFDVNGVVSGTARARALRLW